MNNPLSIYYAFLTDRDEVDWLACLEKAKAAGLDGVELSAPKLRSASPAARQEIARQARALALGLTFATALSPGQDLTSVEPAIRQAAVEQLKQDLALVAQMGGQALGGVLTAPSKIFPPGAEHIRRHLIPQAAPALHEAGQAAYALGIRLCLEPVNRFETPWVNTCQEALALVEAADSPGLGLLLDTFHMNIEEADPGAAIRLAGKRLFHFHACENDRSLPGKGHISWPLVLAQLKAADYQGFLCMESLWGPYGAVASRLNIWRTLCRQPAAALTQCVCYLRNLMKEAGE